MSTATEPTVDTINPAAVATLAEAVEHSRQLIIQALAVEMQKAAHRAVDSQDWRDHASTALDDVDLSDLEAIRTAGPKRWATSNGNGRSIDRRQSSSLTP